MSIYSQKPIDLAGISTYPLDSRPSKVSVNGFARPLTDGEVSGVAALIDSLPRMLGAEDLRAVARAIVAARAAKRAIIWGLGGHVIKTGLAPIVTDLAQRGFVTAIALNGSGIIHDFEIALAGTTSEDVDEALGSGSFGMAEETGRLINEAIKRGAADQLGIGEAIGRTLAEISPKFAEYSLLHAAYKMRIPVTVHVTVGTDIVHLHPQADGAAIGEASHRDFRLFTSLVKGMSGGGVYLNVGSAVTLPEVFLKAVTVVRNMGDELRGLTTVNCDFLQHYRPLTNVVRRPVAGGAGRGYSLTGHHEIMLPLLAAAVRSLSAREKRVLSAREKKC